MMKSLIPSSLLILKCLKFENKQMKPTDDKNGFTDEKG